ncbi:MAG: oxidoreductase, partial [Gammaproteobacteria bacterium]
PQTARLIELLKEKTIGEIKLIRASFGFAASLNPDSRLFKNELGGGAIMDVGCYPVSMARLIAGAVDGRPFLNPVSVRANGVKVQTGVDGTAAAVLKFENDIVAELTTSIQVSLDNQVVVIGTEGRIVVPDPWMTSRIEPRDGLIEVHAQGRVQKINIPANRTSFSYEADVFATTVFKDQQEAESPAMTWDDTLGNLKVLDRWREAVGIIYANETPEAQQDKTVAGRSLARRQNHTMRYLRVEGVDKDISQMLMGCDNQRTFAHAAVMFDDWFERGGNAFDTAHIYGGGLQERLLGQWINARGVRNEVVILSKGGHTPFCYPEAIAKELQESLDRLQTDHVDLYILHRDNPDIPVGEFVDLLHEQRMAGRIGVFGGSNWSIDRIREANEYARQHGKHGFSVLSNNLSLAEMVRPVWTGCLHVSDPESRAWLTKNQFPNFAWSSQARGYFLPESLRMRLGTDNFQCWDSPENRARRERAEQLADQLGVSPINIAAAYVLNQPFPSFALIGPRSIEETISSLRAMDIKLTSDQIEWLWTG